MERSSRARPRRPATITIASILFFVWGLVLCAVLLQILTFLISTHTFPVFNGVQMFEAGYFQGRDFVLKIAQATIVLVICGLQIVAGHWLWRSLKKGGWLGFLLLGLGLFYAISLSAPGLLIAGVPGTILIAAGWNSLR